MLFYYKILYFYEPNAKCALEVGRTNKAFIPVNKPGACKML